MILNENNFNEIMDNIKKDKSYSNDQAIEDISKSLLLLYTEKNGEKIQEYLTITFYGILYIGNPTWKQYESKLFSDKILENLNTTELDTLLYITIGTAMKYVIEYITHTIKEKDFFYGVIEPIQILSELYFPTKQKFSFRNLLGS